MAPPPPLRLFFDYVDPNSYLLEIRLQEAAAGGTGVELLPEPFELRPPPQPLLPLDDGEWSRDWDRLQAEAEAWPVKLKKPRIIPWSRKAHELAFHAGENGCFREIHDAIFRAYFEEGQDIGRVDVLVGLARKCGLDPMEAKVVLDVDRFRDRVEAKRAEGLRAGIHRTPTLLAGEHSLEGWPGTEALEAFMARVTRDEHS